MHNSQDGDPVDADGPNQWLLKDASPTDVCLGCHADRLGSVFVSDPLAPPREIGGGNFTFLLEDNINDGHNGHLHPIPGHAAGHSVVAPSMGVGADPLLTMSPGGNFPSSLLGCTSCHDPHGNANFRLLYGASDVHGGLFEFTNAAPEAEGMSIFGGPPESGSNHTAYQGGMSAWCGNCHGDFHDSGDFVHPSGRGMSGFVTNLYGVYNGTSDQLGGDPATAYLAQVPFEDPSSTTSYTAAPTGDSEVSCITCHRAHATSSPDAGRWDFNVTGLAEDGLESLAYAIPNPYDNFQRSLCNKCHNKDKDDALIDFSSPAPLAASVSGR
jgi:cytochrome c553